MNHITGYFHWAQTLKFGGMRHWKKTSYPLTNQGIFGDNQFPINQDQSWLLSNFVKVFFYNNFGSMSVFFEDLATESAWWNAGIPHEIERAILSCCTLFFLNGYLLSYTRRIYNDACLPTISAWNCKHFTLGKCKICIYKYIPYKFSIGSVNLKIVHLSLSCSQSKGDIYLDIIFLKVHFCNCWKIKKYLLSLHKSIPHNLGTCFWLIKWH